MIYQEKTVKETIRSEGTYEDLRCAGSLSFGFDFVGVVLLSVGYQFIALPLPLPVETIITLP